MNDLTVEIDDGGSLDAAIVEQIVIGSGGDVGPATETEWGTVKVAEPIEGHAGYAKISHAKDGAVGTYDFYTPRLSSTSDTINEDLLPKADTSTYGVVKVYPNDGQQGGYVLISGDDIVRVPIIGDDTFEGTIRDKYIDHASSTTWGTVKVSPSFDTSGGEATVSYDNNGQTGTFDVPVLSSGDTIKASQLPPATSSAYGAIKMMYNGDSAGGYVQMTANVGNNNAEFAVQVPRIESTGTIRNKYIPAAVLNGGEYGGVKIANSLNVFSIGYKSGGNEYTANIGKAEDVARSASIDSSGLITFKNISGTSVFTLQLPIYNGGVS